MRRIALAIVAGAVAVVLLGAGSLQQRSVGAGVASGSGFAAVVGGAVVTQGFGCTWIVFEPVDPACPTGHFHSGIDLAAPAGRPVFAAADGTSEVVNSAGGYGLHLVVQHSRGLSTLYGHLSAVVVASGELVTAGQEVGLVGSTGMSTGPHLHFEVRLGNVPVDPTVWLHALQGVLPGQRS